MTCRSTAGTGEASDHAPLPLVVAVAGLSARLLADPYESSTLAPFRKRGWNPMAHDAFISYCSRDKPTADAVCTALEGQGIRCWIAPRDVTPSINFSQSIKDAIQSSRLLVLVLSSAAN